MMTIKEIRDLMENSDFEVFGLRSDDYEYNVGDDAHVSHQLFQDPDWDEDGNLIYPEGEGIYAGFYDAGDLDGTCAIEISEYDNDDKIARKINTLPTYCGKRFYLIGGNGGTYGNDVDEIVVRDAKIIAILN